MFLSHSYPQEHAGRYWQGGKERKAKVEERPISEVRLITSIHVSKVCIRPVFGKKRSDPFSSSVQTGRTVQTAAVMRPPESGVATRKRAEKRLNTKYKTRFIYWHSTHRLASSPHLLLISILE